MNPNAANKGRSFKGAIAYIIHDPDQAETDERVLFVETRNLRTDDPEKAAKVMAYTAMHAAELKAEAGIKATGRKTESPVYHLSLSWVPGEQPSQAEMMEAGEAALKVLGYSEHEAVYAAHGDKAHMHLHIVVNRIHPLTGKTHNPKDDQKLLQAWGHEYDKGRGLEHRSPERAARHEKDAGKRAEYKRIAEAAREKKGAANDNTRSRASWDAAKGATHPKSRRYVEITSEYGARAKALATESRALYAQQRRAWTDLGARHKQERAALVKPGLVAGKARAAFDAVRGGPERLTPAQFQREIKTLKASQRIELRKFQAEQRAQGRAFERQEQQTGDRLAATLQAVTRTPVGLQGPEHRGHLAARFKHEARRQERAEQSGQTKADARLETLKERQGQDSQTLRSRLKVDRPSAGQQRTVRQQRAALANQQRTERRELRQHQQGQRQELQGKWASLNDDRAQAWDSYRAQRADQAATKSETKGREDRGRDGETLKDIYAERSGLYESRRIEGRDYTGKGAEPGGRSQGGGRAIKIDKT